MNFRLIKSYFFIVFILMSVWSCQDAINDPYHKISCEQKSSLPGNGRSSAVGFAINGKGYIALGRKDFSNGALKDCWEYNPADDSWTEKKQFPGLARVKSVAAVVDGKAYVGLGYNPLTDVYSEISFLKDFWMFDPLSNTWTVRASYPSEATDACVSFVVDGIIYVGAGYKHLSFARELWAYNPITNTWSNRHEMTPASRSGGIACSDGERVFFGNGFMIYNKDDWWEYFPRDDSWKKRRNTPDRGRINSISFSIDHRFYIATGRHWGGDVDGGQLNSDLIEYNPKKNRWYNRGDITGGGRENAISFVIDGKAYVGFGENDAAILNDFWCFVP